MIGPMRKGPAMALGGGYPTVTDAIIVAGHGNFGDKQKAYKAMAKLALEGQPVRDVANKVLDSAAEKIVHGIRQMLDIHEAEPVYRVEDIVNAVRFSPEMLIGVGGAAAGLVPLVAAKLNLPGIIPQGAMLANAIGAAVARPTIDINLRADT